MFPHLANATPEQWVLARHGNHHLPRRRPDQHLHLLLGVLGLVMWRRGDTAKVYGWLTFAGLATAFLADRRRSTTTHSGRAQTV